MAVSIDLSGQAALITGAGRGIGREVAIRLARAGAFVGLVSRTESELDETLRLVYEEPNANGGAVLPADVSDTDAMTAAVTEFIGRTGRLDILVNNAAIHKPKPVLDTTLEEWNETISINLSSCFICTRIALSHMISRRQGRVINISSGAGLRGVPGNAPYSVAKGGMIAFSQALSGEVKEHGIRVNVVCPGPIMTSMHAQRPDEGFLADDSVFLQPRDVADTVLFLASPMAGGTTAQIFHVRNSDRW